MEDVDGHLLYDYAVDMEDVNGHLFYEHAGYKLLSLHRRLSMRRVCSSSTTIHEHYMYVPCL